MRPHAVIAKDGASTTLKPRGVLDKPIRGDYLMALGFGMTSVGFVVFHQWGWVLGGILFFLIGCGMFAPEYDIARFFQRLDKEEGGHREEGDGTENLSGRLPEYK